jgi:hypothetical protein
VSTSADAASRPADLFGLRRGERGEYMTDARVRAHGRRALDLDSNLCV